MFDYFTYGNEIIQKLCSHYKGLMEKNYCEFDKVLSEWDSLKIHNSYNCPHNCVNKI